MLHSSQDKSSEGTPKMPPENSPNITTCCVPESRTNKENDDVYTTLVGILKERLNPSQVDALAQMLQSTKRSVHQEETAQVGSSTLAQSPLECPQPPQLGVRPELESPNSNQEDMKPELYTYPYTVMHSSKPVTQGWKEFKAPQSGGNIKQLSEYFCLHV